MPLHPLQRESLLTDLASQFVAERPAPEADHPTFSVGDDQPAGTHPPCRQATLDTAGAAPLVEMVLAAHFYREHGRMPAWAVAA